MMDKTGQLGLFFAAAAAVRDTADSLGKPPERPLRHLFNAAPVPCGLDWTGGTEGASSLNESQRNHGRKQNDQ